MGQAVSLEQHRMNTMASDIEALKALVKGQQAVIESMSDTMEKLVDLVSDMIEDDEE